MECTLEERILEKEGGSPGSEFQPPFCHFIIEYHQASCLTFPDLDISEDTMESCLKIGKAGMVSQKAKQFYFGIKSLRSSVGPVMDQFCGPEWALKPPCVSSF